MLRDECYGEQVGKGTESTDEKCKYLKRSALKISY